MHMAETAGTNDRILIETQDLKKYFKAGGGRKIHALDGINIKIKHGETLGVVGESGCGKTTLGRTVLRLHEPTSGRIILDGEDITTLRESRLRKYRPKMQIVFQDPFSSINPRMTVEDIIVDPMVVNGMYKSSSERYARVEEIMDMVGLAERFATCFPHEISGGLRQRVGIARALAVSPSFIVCDEPVSSLDVSIQAQIINLLMDLQDSLGLAYMFITHDLSVVKHISDKIAVMYLGQIVELAPSREIFKNPVHPYTQALLKSIPVPNLKSREMLQDVIQGEVSNPIDPEPVCRFAERCPHRSAECETEQELVEISDGHYVACCKVSGN